MKLLKHKLKGKSHRIWADLAQHKTDWTDKTATHGTNELTGWCHDRRTGGECITKKQGEKKSIIKQQEAESSPDDWEQCRELNSDVR